MKPLHRLHAIRSAKHTNHAKKPGTLLHLFRAFRVFRGSFALFLCLLPALALAEPARRVTNTEHEDGSGSSKDIDPEKRQSIESFFDQSRKPLYKIVYQLDSRLQAQSGIYYNNAGRIFQKSTYTFDGADRMIQEIVYDAKDTLVCTKNYIWGTRFGKPSLLEVHTYDRNGRLSKTQKVGADAAPTVPSGKPKKR